MSGTAKHGARPVTHQHEIRDIDGQCFPVDKWMFDFKPRIKPELGRRRNRLFSRANFRAVGSEVLNFRVCFCDFFHKRVIRR